MMELKHAHKVFIFDDIKDKEGNPLRSFTFCAFSLYFCFKKKDFELFCFNCLVPKPGFEKRKNIMLNSYSKSYSSPLHFFHTKKN